MFFKINDLNHFEYVKKQAYFKIPGSLKYVFIYNANGISFKPLNGASLEPNFSSILIN